MVVAVKNRRFDLPDHYYVYGFAKPDGSWFYIGKGKGPRIIKHFSSYNMNQDSWKNRVIKKYGKDNIHKEIFAYFEDEESAYELEEFIISEIGIDNLTNTFATRKDAGFVCKEWSGWERVRQSNTKYSDEQIIECYRLYYEEDLSPYNIEQAVGVPRMYLKKIFAGKARVDLYDTYVVSGLIKDNRNPDKRKAPIVKQLDEAVLRDYYLRVINMEMSVVDAASEIGIAQAYLRQIFNGDIRDFYGFDLRNDKETRSIKTRQRDLRKKKIGWFLDQGFSTAQISKITGHSRSYLHVIKQELEDESLCR